VRTLRVEIRAESDVQGTLLFLQGLERGDKLIRIDRLDISHTARSDDKDAEVLSIAATISGFAVSDTMMTAAVARPAVASVPPSMEAPR
jgi:hypothetical protein